MIQNATANELFWYGTQYDRGFSLLPVASIFGICNNNKQGLSAVIRDKEKEFMAGFVYILAVICFAFPNN